MLAFLFVDGMGLSDDPRSPLRTLELPTLSKLSNNWSSQPFEKANLAYRVLDANLGIEGLPQSGTGQTSLLTGVNAAALLGFHQGPHPLTRLQAVLREESIQVWASRKSLKVLHANSYRPEYLQRVQDSRRNILSSFAYAAQTAGLTLLPIDHPNAILPAFWPEPEQAGAHFARVAEQYHLSILENWSLDYSAHRVQDKLDERFLELDRFVCGFLNASPKATLVITADHGNAEEPWHTQHTNNPVPCIFAGVNKVPAMQSLTDVAPWMRDYLLRQ